MVRWANCLTMMRKAWRIIAKQHGRGLKEVSKLSEQALTSNSLLELAHGLDGALVNAILLDNLAVMEHVELLGGILARKEHDGFLATGVVGKEVGYIVDIVFNNDPAVRVGGMLGDLLL